MTIFKFGGGEVCAEDGVFEAHDKMARLIFGSRILAQVLKCVAQFGVADHLAAGSRHPSELAADVGLDASSTTRLLRYCATIGLTRRDEDGRYEGTEMLDTLRSDGPHRLRSFCGGAERSRTVGRFRTT